MIETSNTERSNKWKNYAHNERVNNIKDQICELDQEQQSNLEKIDKLNSKISATTEYNSKLSQRLIKQASRLLYNTSIRKLTLALSLSFSKWQNMVEYSNSRSKALKSCLLSSHKRNKFFGFRKWALTMYKMKKQETLELINVKMNENDRIK